MTSEQKYDVIYGPDTVSIEPHFCREWGCFGSNPEHGYTLEEAADKCAEYHEKEAEMFRDGSHYLLDFYKSQTELHGESYDI